MATQTYYDVLGVHPDTDPAGIKKAYRRLARQYHPDINPDEDAVEVFQRITDIYRVLLDPVERERYDHMIGGSERVIIEDAPEDATDTAEGLYQRGLSQAKRGNYRDAVVIFSQALSLDQNYIDAYTQRGFAYYSLQNYPAALSDYSAALRLNLHLTPVHFYRGLVRFDLGDTEAAIKDFTSALELDPSYAKAYYRRGLAYADVGDRRAAAVDLKQAVKSFTRQGNVRGAREAQAALKQVDGWLLLRVARGKPLLPFRDAALVINRLSNPSGGLLPTFVRLGHRRAIAVGLLFGALFALCSSLKLPLAAALPPPLSFVAGLLPLLTLTLTKRIGRGLLGGYSSLAGDVFTAGVALLPASVAVLLLGTPLLVSVSVLAIALSYAVLIFYSGCSQIANLPEAKAAVLTALLMVATVLPILKLLGF
ncbi:MAG: tetratricopeptide repeat protein [Elainellaceae cyanobacterium]